MTQMKKDNHMQNKEAIVKIYLIIFMLLTFCNYKNLMAESLNAEGQNQNGSINYEKYYNNVEYLYSFKMPDGFLCVSNAPPSPNHGCRINLSKTPESYIWVTGKYNSTDSLSPADELLRMMDPLIKDGMRITILKRTVCNLGNLSGERLAIDLKNEEITESIVEDKVVAFRIVKDYGEIIYTVGLVTTKSRYESDKKIFELVLKSWKEENLRNSSEDNRGPR